MKDDLTIDWKDASNVPPMVQKAMKDFISDMEGGFYIAGFCDSKRNATGNGGDKPPPIAANDADHSEHCVHVKSPWLDFVAELNTCHFNFLFIRETWRGEKDGSFITEKGHHIYLSGGANHQGVGICISAMFVSQVSHISFHAYSKRICSLRFSMVSRRFKVFCVYFPTAWDADGAVEQMYDVLNLLVDACVLKQGTYRL